MVLRHAVHHDHPGAVGTGIFNRDKFRGHGSESNAKSAKRGYHQRNNWR
jgi:hypothetical protein